MNLLTSAGFIVFLCLGLLHSQTMPVPLNLQGALFKKILNMNKSIQGEGVKLAVVYDDPAQNDQISEGFRQVGIFPTLVSINNLENEIGKFNVVYISPGCRSVKSITEKYKVLSISGIPELATRGEAAIVLGVESGKPRIIINSRKLKSEGQELSPELIKLSKVI